MKKILSIFSIIMIVFSLCGCHGKKEDSLIFTVPSDFDMDKTYEITFWAKNDNNINQINVYKRAIEDFEKLYPNIKVSMKLYTDYTVIYNDVITNIATDTTPNVCITYPDHIATYLTGANTMVNLEELMSNEKYGFGGSDLKYDGPTRKDIIPEFLNECIVNEKYYALPYMRSTEALYINKTMLNKLGYDVPDVLTWDFVFEVSKKAIAKDNDGNFVINGQKTFIPFIYKSTDNMMISMLKQKNIPYSDESGKVLMFNEDTKDILLTIGEYSTLKAFSTFKISSYPANFLNAGQCIFAVDSTAGSTWMGSNAPLIDIPEEELVDFETVIRPIPQYDTNNIKMISQGPSICVFSKDDSQEVLASWIFAQYLLTDSVQCAYSKTEGYVPVTSKAQNSKEYVEYLNNAGIDNNEHYDIKIAATKLLLENTDNTFVTPVFNGSASLRNAAGQLVEETCKGARRGKNIDSKFVDELYENINSLNRLDQINSISGQKDLGPLPIQSKVFLISLVGIWMLIGIRFFMLKKKGNK